ncbi:MAG: hypothetical protein J7D96_22705 [Escherichia coli]|nr:hypothetical protein [Escherichia coli]
MDTIHYLTSIINLLQKTPEAQEIIDAQGLGQELTFGQIGLTDIGAFLKLHNVLSSVEGAEITPIREYKTDYGKQYTFRLVAPVNLYFFHCAGVFE